MTDLETLPQSTVPEETDLVMTLAGADAIHFLQGQTTADFENTEPGAVRFAAFCNPKGRVIADVLAIVVSNEAGHAAGPASRHDRAGNPPEAVPFFF